MPRNERFSTKYPGVFYVMGTSIMSGKPERIYRIRYRKDGRMIEETVGRQYQHRMTAAQANTIRSDRMSGKQSTNREKREKAKAKKSKKANRFTFNKLWETYKENVPLKGLDTDEARFTKYIEPVFGDMEPNELLPLMVKRLERGLSKKLKPQTVKHVLALIRRLALFGLNNELCEGLTFKIAMPSFNNEKTEDLSPDQINQLFQVLDDFPNIQGANLVKLALFTGMRRGELFRLKWDDINFDRGFVRIRDPKGKEDQDIPLNGEALAVLENHPRSDSPYVFPGKDGKQRTTIKRLVNKIKKDAGLPGDFRPLHGLRHVYASTLASSGQVDLYTLQRLLTHKTPNMTQRYAHLRDEALRRASDLAGSLIKGQINEEESTPAKKSG